MKPGAGKAKGSAFEREVGKQLSLWVSGGHRADLFARNVLSGGQFTSALAHEQKEHGTPGDLVANHPTAFRFLQCFSVECKHHADVDLEGFLFDRQDRSFLGKTFKHTQGQAALIGRDALVIAKQNRRPSFVLCGRKVGAAMLYASAFALHHHLLQSDRLFMVLFDELTNKVNPDRLLSYHSAAREEEPE
jgi:hypothetical protein